jgi:hypothetical protein
MKTMQELESHLDAVAGCQLAQSLILNLLADRLRGNSGATDFLRKEAESMKADMLASRASDEKIRYFDEMIESYVRALSS